MWLLSAHGITDHLPAERAAELETQLVAKLREVVAELVPAGHNGVGATFTGEHVGTVALTDLDVPGPAPPAEPQGELADGTPGPAPDGPPPTADELAAGEQTT